MEVGADGDAGSNVLPKLSNHKQEEEVPEQQNVCEPASQNELKPENEQERVDVLEHVEKQPKVSEICDSKDNSISTASYLSQATKVVIVPEYKDATSSKPPDDQNSEIPHDEPSPTDSGQALEVKVGNVKDAITSKPADDQNPEMPHDEPSSIDSGQALQALERKVGDVSESEIPVSDVLTEKSELVVKGGDEGNENDCESKPTTVTEGGDLLKTPESRDCILKPLLLSTGNSDKATDMNKEDSLSALVDVENSDFAANQTPCMLCDNMYENVDKKEEHDEYLCHLIVEHELVIADVKLIADLRTYALYWKRRFAEKPVKDFCALIRTNTGAKDTHDSEEYYLLCDALLEDRRVREKLQLDRLKELIDRQTEERNCADFDRMCLFCTKFFIGDRDELFTHMNEDHNFNVGHPQNLIYVDEFLDAIEEKLNKLECLFCDRVFKDRASLREHMRKKSHRRLNPKNKLYDKYYIINYLELGKNWEVLQNEPEHFDAADDWSGWDETPQNAVCFFCNASFDVQDEVYVHMKGDHDFDFQEMRKSMSLSFYQQVKMINYIRREVHKARETARPEKEASEKESSDAQLDKAATNKLARVIKESILNTTKWNQPQYYFPTYENDTLLCQVEDKEGLFEPEDTFIIGEDGIDCKAIINDSVLTDLVITGYFD